uniref:COesterase domain-containing protein n=1 Tax=Syphacia muris TaxID=451379 RepID=A0A0N5ALG3_9BILA
MHHGSILSATAYGWIMYCCVVLEKKSQCHPFPTKYGQIVGKQFCIENGRYVNAFLGIPFAAPPIGDLRFKSSSVFCQSKKNCYFTKQIFLVPLQSKQRVKYIKVLRSVDETCSNVLMISAYLKSIDITTVKFKSKSNEQFQNNKIP